MELSVGDNSTKVESSGDFFGDRYFDDHAYRIPDLELALIALFISKVVLDPNFSVAWEACCSRETDSKHVRMQVSLTICLDITDDDVVSLKSASNADSLASKGPDFSLVV